MVELSGRAMTALLVGLTVSAMGACASDSPNSPAVDPGPPRICKTPAKAEQPWFQETTASAGLAKTAELAPVGSCMVSADLDADGFSDLVSMGGDSRRELASSQRFLFMSRPSDSDPKRRVLANVPDQAGLLATREGTEDRGASIAVLGDLDNDGHVDMVTCPADFKNRQNPDGSPRTVWDPCAAFLNDGSGRFTLAAESDLDTVVPAPSGVLVDYDRDGILDFWPALIAHWPESGYKELVSGPRLFRGNGDGTFALANESVGLPLDDSADPLTQFRPNLGVTTCDLDDDGDQDVLLASYGRHPNVVYRNDGGKFVEVAAKLGLDHDELEDYSDDQSYRCYCADTKSCSPMPPPPTVGCADFGGKHYRGWVPGVTDQPWRLGGNSMGVACADADDDGDMDVMFAEITHGDVGKSSDPTELILNPGDGGSFTRPGNEATGLARPALGLKDDYYDHQAVFVDVDLDGRKDLLVLQNHVNQGRPWLWRQDETGHFAEITTAAGLPAQVDVGAAFIDVDADGDLDLVAAVTPDHGLRVFENRVGQEQNSVRVRLVGRGKGFSNVSAIGARVRVTAGGRAQTLEVKGGQGLGNIQGDFTLTFGLGSSCDVDRIEVRWPDAQATVSVYENVAANYLVVLSRGDPKPEYR